MTDKQFNQLIVFNAIGFIILAILICLSFVGILEKLPLEEPRSKENKQEITTTVETDNLIFE